ncbi:aminotransferase class V-fold PLP-dependent enzyme [Halorhodospira sp. 9622]|uniref:aminotransferase class V-fold PLP-dependent enzyme n=1 Tax=Halorhodospira sp. 9622 TaxID=2899136 RepID=UPI001EE81C14|nr:aminotransferase class V-fold PLP-dependent enzyme [Halorhodospira sp. 9622]
MTDRIPRYAVLDSNSLARWPGPMPASVLDRPELVFTERARQGITLILRALNLRAGEHILLPAYHCTSMVTPVLQAGARVSFFRVLADGTADLDDMYRRLQARPRAVLVSHYFGFPQPMDQIVPLTKQAGTVLVEDCAHALFGSIETGALGSFGDYAIASPWKFLPVRLGGCVARNNTALPAIPKPPWGGIRGELRDLLNTLERSTEHDRLAKLRPLLAPLHYRSRRRLYRASMAGPGRPPTGPEELSGGETAPLRLSYAATWIIRHTNRFRVGAQRRAHYLRLARAWSDLPGAHALYPDLPANTIPQVFPLVTEKPAELAGALAAAGIPVIRFGGERWSGTPPRTCRHAERLSASVLQLPCHQSLQSPELERLMQTVRSALGAAARPRPDKAPGHEAHDHARKDKLARTAPTR